MRKLFDWLKIGCTVFTKRANEIVGQLVSLVNIAANLAYIALFTLGFGFRFNVVLVIGVCHGFGLRNHTGFGNAANKHSVGIKVNVLLNLKRHKGINISWQENKPVIRTKRCTVGEFVGISAAFEAERLKHSERRIGRKAVYIHDARLLNYMVRIIFLINGYGDTVRRICDLSNGVYDKSVVLFLGIPFFLKERKAFSYNAHLGLNKDGTVYINGCFAIDGKKMIDFKDTDFNK